MQTKIKPRKVLEPKVEWIRLLIGNISVEIIYKTNWCISRKKKKTKAKRRRRNVNGYFGIGCVCGKLTFMHYYMHDLHCSMNMWLCGMQCYFHKFEGPKWEPSNTKQSQHRAQPEREYNEKFTYNIMSLLFTHCVYK